MSTDFNSTCYNDADKYVFYVLTVALMLQCCDRLSSSVVCNVRKTAKRCVLEQKLLLTAYRKSYMKNRLVPKWMTLTFV